MSTVAIKEKTKYSDSELQEFKELIETKRADAKKELLFLRSSLDSDCEKNGTLEDGADALEKENINGLADRQQKLIRSLDAALLRINNKTYGICRETGKLIQAERLRAVPHTTLSMEAKLKFN